MGEGEGVHWLVGGSKQSGSSDAAGGGAKVRSTARTKESMRVPDLLQGICCKGSLL